MSVNVTNLGLVKIKSFSADPSNTDAGLMYYNSVSGKFRYYNGSAWADIAGSAGASTTLNNLTSPTAINQHLLFNTTNTYDVGSQTSLLRNVILGGVVQFWNGIYNPGQIYASSTSELTVGSSNGATLTLIANGGTVNVVSANPVNVNGQQINNVANPTTAQGVATKNYVDVLVSAYAPLASPSLTGTPTAPTATIGTNTTQIATTAFVTAAVAGAGSGANTALSNLASTSVNADIIPSANNAVDLGSSLKMFRSVYAYTNVYTNNIVGIGGTTSFDANNLWFTANGTNGPAFQVTDSGALIRASNSDVLRDLRFGKDRSNTSYTILRGTQSVAGDTLFQLPPTNGTAGYALTTDGTGITSWASFVSSSLLGANNGVATLDSGGKVPATQLPNSVMTFEGVWNASTNTPTLADGTGNTGMVYQTTVAGTQNLGSGSQTFAVGDWVMYNASGIWQKSINSNAVVSVNSQTGIVSLTTDNIPEGTTNLYFTNARAVAALSASLAGKANVALDNLSAVAINTDLLSAADNTIKIGSSTNYFANTYSKLITTNGSINPDAIDSTTPRDIGNLFAFQRVRAFRFSPDLTTYSFTGDFTAGSTSITNVVGTIPAWFASGNYTVFAAGYTARFTGATTSDGSVAFINSFSGTTMTMNTQARATGTGISFTVTPSMTVRTEDQTTRHSALIQLKTGNATTLESGQVIVASGTSTTGKTGDTVIATGSSSSGGLTGNVVVNIGSTSGTKGKFRITNAGEGTIGHVWTSTDTTGGGSWAAIPASGATTSLNNLSAVAINTSLLPASDNSISLGSSTLSFAEVHSVNAYIHASTTDFVVEKAVASTSVAANTTTLISGLSFAHATYKSAIIHYQISEATTNSRRVGTLYVTTDGTTTSIADTNADTAAISVDFSAAINGANLEISAVSTTANICSFRAKESLFLS